MMRWYKKEPVSTTPEWASLEEECSQEYCKIAIRCMKAFHWVLSEECQKMESGRLTELQAVRAIREDVEGFFYGATTPSQVLELFLKHGVFITVTEKDGDREIKYITEKSIEDSVHAYKKAQEKGREVQQKGKENKEKREARKAKDAERKRREYAKRKEKDKAERAGEQSEQKDRNGRIAGYSKETTRNAPNLASNAFQGNSG